MSIREVLAQILTLPSFYTISYQEDIVRLAIASREAFDPYVRSALAFINHIVEEHDIWHQDMCIEEMQSDALFEAIQEKMCLSCGMRPGESWLGGTECSDCFYDH